MTLPFAKLFLVLPAIISATLAQSACSGQQYNNLPGFPASQSGCYPTTYYRTSDLGSTSPDDAKSRCQQQCTADTRCSSVVAQVNKAADSNNYSGTCFFFSSGSDPTGPRRCADTAYLLLGYKKDFTLDCFSSSLSSASQYCSSYLSIPVVTNTATSTPPVVSTTTTTTTTPTSSVTVTTTTTPTTTKTMTTTVTTTVATSTITATDTTSTTKTSTATAVTTVTVTVTSTTRPVKRAAAAATVPPPACVTSGTPATRLSAACKCLSVATSTSTTTTVLPPKTSSFTATSTVPTTTTLTTTATAAPITTSTTVTATSSVTATTIASTTTTITFSTSTTTTTTSTQTVTVTTSASDSCGTYRPPPPGTYCGNNICYYDEYYCAMTDVDNCGNLCAQSAQCEVAQYASGTCVLYDGCNCAYKLKRGAVLNGKPFIAGSSAVGGLQYFDKATGKWFTADK